LCSTNIDFPNILWFPDLIFGKQQIIFSISQLQWRQTAQPTGITKSGYLHDDLYWISTLKMVGLQTVASGLRCASADEVNKVSGDG